MGLFGFMKKQLVAVIDWTESENGVLAYRFPMVDNLIQTGAQLTVRETQAALFVNEGEVADLFGPGRYELATKNLPLMTALNNWDKGFASPFKSDVYFFSLREQLDQKWGTQQPVTFRDKELGPIRMRAFGNFAYKLADPKAFFKKVSGSRELFTVADMDGQLRAGIMTWIASALGQAETPFFEMAASQAKFSEVLKATLAPSFAEYGLQLTQFFVQSLSLPESVQEHVDKLASMRMAGDLQRYTQFQAAESLGVAAANPGGAAGAGVGLGAGVAMGQALAQSMTAGGSSGAAAGGAPEDALKKLDQLHDLMGKGVITQAEFDAKKAELLKRIT
jgi:membrane protease subunit (stomatin/prohibitin family)